MKNLQVLFLCLSAIVLAACSNEEMPGASKSELNVISSIAPMKRAPQLDESGAGSFKTGDKNTLFFQSAEGSHLLTFDYTYGEKYYWMDLELPKETETCKISACYPAVTTGTPATFAWDVIKEKSNSDFLFATPILAQTNSSSPVRLTFSHAMHKLAVELIADGTSVSAEELAVAELSCNNFKPTANLNLLEGKAVSASGSLAKLDAKGAKSSFIIPAQPTGTMEIAVKLGDRTATYKLSSCQVKGQPLTELLSGQSFTLKIRVSKNSFTIVGQDISGWGNQGEFEDSIII